MSDKEDINYEALKNEVEFYRQNQSTVEREIKLVIEDNQKLSKQVGLLLKEKLENARCKENGLNQVNMDEQVSLLTKERDSLHVLWQTAQKTIDALEAELKAYQGYDRGQQNIIHDRRNLELKLETSITDYIEIERKQKELLTKNSNLQNELKSREKEIESYRERGKEMDEKLKEQSRVLEELRVELASEKKSGEEVRNQLIASQKENCSTVKKEAEAKSKVAEALHLFDVVSAQKNEANKAIRKLTEESNQLKKELSSIKKVTEDTFRAELDEVKEKYNEKVADMLAHIRNLDTEIVNKGVLLNRTLRENKILQSSNDDLMKQQNDKVKEMNPKLRMAEQRLEAMYQELISSERRNIQLVCEKQSLAMDLQKSQDTHVREIKRREWEESLLNNERNELKLQVEHLQKCLEETHNMVNKLQETLSSRSALNEKMVSTKEEELLELNKHLEKQMVLNKKWKESYMEMTDKLKKRMNDLYEENKTLREQLNINSEEISHNDFSINS